MTLLWIAFALITVAVLYALLRPLMGGAAEAPPAEASADVAVYKAQLAEIESDLARGLMQPVEADIARREIARRLLAAVPKTTEQASAKIALRPVATTIALVVPLVAIGTYARLGAPHLPAVPHAQTASTSLEQAKVDDLVARVEARLATNPDDGQGWDVIAPVYMRLQRYSEAANAYARAAKLLGETTPRLAGIAEASTLAANGIVTDVARQAYEKIAKAEPNRVEPKFWLALALEQDGKTAEAAARYRELLAGAPPDASWRAMVEERLAAVGGGARTAPPQRGPSARDVEAAGKLSDKDRADMIRGMVDGLAKKLSANPNDIPGWQRLVQAYVVLGERERAMSALADARQKLASDPQALAALTELAKSLGLGS